MVIGKLKMTFARHGIPDELTSENGTQFSSHEFRIFASKIGHMTTSPHYAQANGEAERAVRTAKSIIRQDDPAMTFLAYRSTPTTVTGVSPARLLYGREFQTTLPTLPVQLSPQLASQADVKQRDARRKASDKTNYDKRHGSRPLSVLSPGQAVRWKRQPEERGWRSQGVILAKADVPRSYYVQAEQGVYRYNRQHIMPIPRLADEREVTPPAVDRPPTPVRQLAAPEADDERLTDDDNRDVTDNNNIPDSSRVTLSGRVVVTPARYR